MEVRTKPKRGYRSCLNCRARKAKCSLGDVNAPRAPPCDRCARERRVCEYAPSKRGGPKIEGLEKKWVPAELVGLDASGTQALGRSALDGPIPPTAAPEAGSSRQIDQGQRYMEPQPASSSIDWSGKHPWELQAGSAPQLQTPKFAHPEPHVTQTLSHGNQTWFASPASTLAAPTYPPQHVPSEAQVAHTFPASFLSQPGKEPPANMPTNSTTGSGAQQPSPYKGDTPASYDSSIHDGNSSLTGHVGPDGEPLKKKRKRNRSRSPATHRTSQRAIVVADMHNESDALNILAQAAMEGDDDGSLERDGDGDRARQLRMDLEQRYDRSPEHKGRIIADSAVGASASNHDPNHRVSFAQESDGSPDDDPPPTLDEFVLVQMGILSQPELVRLCHVFFKWHHPVFPLIPTRRIPQTLEQIALFADEEVYLLIAIVIITSRHDSGPGTRQVHERSWKVMKDCLSEINYAGTSPTVGLVEALLLLAENPPRDTPVSIVTGKHRHRSRHENQGLQAAENRQAWMMSGMAIRAAYGLGLDQLSRNDDDEHETYEVQRARLAWTYCYLFDRHISLRTGRAFWSRGPSLCFRGYSDLLQSGPAAAKVNFPILAVDGDPNDDSASLVQAYTELTQTPFLLSATVMTNAHDVLYPSTVRTHTLVEHGEYFKFLDDFNRALESFKTVWRHKQWATPVLKDLVSTMLHYVRLYISAFAFQAHVQRTHARAEKEQPLNGAKDGQPKPPTSLFPRGSASTADAPYIYESINAAREILKLCAESLHPQGALRYLPSRFLLWFQYAAVFLLKAIYSGAMVTRDMQMSGQLIEKACLCLATASPDKDHPAVRYGHMIRVLSRKLAHMSDTSAVPSRFPSPVRPTVDLPATSHDAAFAATPQGADATMALNLNHAFTPNTVAGANLDAWLQSTADKQASNNVQPDVTQSAFFDDLFRNNAPQGSQSHADVDIDFNLDGFWENFNPLIEANGAYPL